MKQKMHKYKFTKLGSDGNSLLECLRRLQVIDEFEVKQVSVPASYDISITFKYKHGLKSKFMRYMKEYAETYRINIEEVK